MATDQSVLDHIGALAAEEHALYEKGNLSEAETKRLAEIGIALDRYWDLLRQRRARREFGQDPNEAEMRPASTVATYEA